MKKNHPIPMNVIIDATPNALAAKTDHAPIPPHHGITPTELDRPALRPLGVRYSASTYFRPRFSQRGQEYVSKKQRRKRLVSPCPELPHPSLGQKRLEAMLDHARQEAEALAAATPFPSLVLPCLLEEKLDEARHYAARQQQVWQDSHNILCLAV
jgi:hypothetical protein